jgi:NAD-dependent deacetylase
MQKIFILTGAGLSAESGLGTFRGPPDALWAKHDPYKLATPGAFAADPELVHGFYNHRRAGVVAASPNAAHAALARLQQALAARGGEVFLCTQNVDDLLERAGCTAVVHMHGELRRIRCTTCGARHAWDGPLSTHTPCPSCDATGGLRPDVVWFGEMPKHLDAIGAALEEATLFVAIGTSGSVYPAAGFAAEAHSLGIPRLEINLERSDTHAVFSRHLYGPATETVPRWVNDLLGPPNPPPA